MMAGEVIALETEMYSDWRRSLRVACLLAASRSREWPSVS
eukprot:CAMPEP_0176295934 /NCGR_PEP_ID=MMETSP0121_2-20121125/57928_1 /TAXON_ID=160619 /ORGANISM="Kryptoperidinium foliaceum, Strain CCMP 1326" /LENGTH=39 /DNA_ID= /DNA_START= /DNA_END= /DNA_ORIENTATION=